MLLSVVPPCLLCEQPLAVLLHGLRLEGLEPDTGFELCTVILPDRLALTMLAFLTYLLVCMA